MKGFICWLVGHDQDPLASWPECGRCGLSHWNGLPNSLHVTLWHAYKHYRERWADYRREEQEIRDLLKRPDDIPF